jgi:GntR family transcriptional regulator, transcriptional repressor for pyruvate dehydrogenase complex
MAAAPSSDRVSHLLQRAISARRLRPGERVGTQAELARELGVSRPAVREAVRLLVRANLVRAVRGPGGGVFVANTPGDGLGRTISEAIGGMVHNGATTLEQLTEVRLLLEVPIAGLAAERADAAAIAALHDAIADAERAPADPAAQGDADVRFHRTIVDAAGNAVGSAIAAWCSDVLQPAIREMIAPAIVEAVVREQHREIVAAIEARQPLLAERAMRAHLQYLSDVLETIG